METNERGVQKITEALKEKPRIRRIPGKYKNDMEKHEVSTAAV